MPAFRQLIREKLGVLGLCFVLMGALGAQTQTAWAYPELIRHGYVNCTSCHVSPSGGGVLTEYGRELSSEVLSTWSREGEQSFLYGSVKTPAWLLMGGDYRSVYLYRNRPDFQDGQLIFMQADVEAAATYKRLTFDATFGYQNTAGTKSFGDHFISRRHYVMFKPTDELSVRGGRFNTAFGINTPDHIIVTKRGLNFEDETMENYNLELAWLNEDLNFYATAIIGRPDQPDLNREVGAAFTIGKGIADHNKVGVSYMNLSAPQSTRQLFGPWALLGFTPKFYLLSELDFQRQLQASSTRPTWGGVSYNRLGYEFYKGLHVFGSEEISKLNFGNSNSLYLAHGLGLQLFPRPHFEFNVLFQKRKFLSQFPDYTDYFYIMWHYYL